MLATPTELDHFSRIFTLRHLSAAAKSVGVSQSALSQSLSRLEGKLRVKLFIRSRQGCIPSPAAHLLFAKTNRLRECWAEIETGISDSETQLTGKFRVGCHPSVGAYTLPNLFKVLAVSAPRIEISLDHGYSRTVLEKILRSELDLGFVAGAAKHPDLVMTRLGTDRVGFWGSHRHRSPPQILFSDLSPDQLRRLMRSRSLRARFMDWQTVETPSLELIRTLVHQGAGVGILPERVARSDQPDLVRLAGYPEYADEIFLVYRPDTLRSVSGKAVIAAARSVLSASRGA